MITSRLKKLEKSVNADRRGLLVLFQDDAGRLTDRAGKPVKEDALVGTVVIFGDALAGI